MQVESSLAFYDKVVDIWYKFLASVRSDASLAENVGKAQLSEGMDMLTRVLNTRVNLLGETHIATVSELVLNYWYIVPAIQLIFKSSAFALGLKKNIGKMG